MSESLVQAKQLIDESGTFTNEFESWVNATGVEWKGFNYSVVTVLGCQSSGKSTLLNELFGTGFRVMDATQGRRQTTKGLWMALDKKNDTLILDVEGTDSKERGEDRLTFEHRAALFSLALADIVIVNMWYNDLGRYTASNYGLLKTVLAVNLQLFLQQDDPPRTTLLFVIRDYSESLTPLTTLTEMIRADIGSIWDGITKPEGRASSAGDFFSFHFCGLPSKILETTTFAAKVQSLREVLFTELRPKTYSRRIPADGFAFYTRSVWETILQSSELDIPSQKEMLATYRCEEIKAATLGEILHRMPAFYEKAKQGTLPVKDFSWASDLIVDALQMYDGPASRYHTTVFLKKRDQLLQGLQHELQKVIDAHLFSLRQQIANSAQNALSLLLAPTNSVATDGALNSGCLDCWSDFATTMRRWEDDLLRQFDSSAAAFKFEFPSGDDTKPRSVMEFDSSQSRQALLESLTAIKLRAQEKQNQLFERAFIREVKNQLADVEVHLNNSALDAKQFWAKMDTLLHSILKSSSSNFQNAWLGLHDGAEASQEQWTVFAVETIAYQLRGKLEQLSEWLHSHVVSRFQHFFDQDDKGVPRQWQALAPERIKDAYVHAHSKAIELFDFFLLVSLDVTKIERVNPSLAAKLRSPLLSEVKHQQMVTRANRQMHQMCQTAQLIQASGGVGTRVPWWIWVLLLALGYNEITMILFSPISLLLLLVGAVVVAISYATNNLTLPLQLARQLLGMVATSVIPILSALQAGPEPSRQLSRSSLPSARRPSNRGIIQGRGETNSS